MKKAARLDLQLLPHELNRWKAAADRSGLPVEVWIRETVNVALIPQAKETLADPKRRSDYGREHRRTRIAAEADRYRQTSGLL